MTDPLGILRTALSDRYAFERELGQGGMATVYLAKDQKHDRYVAVKVLRPELAAALGRERFLREIKLAARLQHPNVLPVYDSGAADGVLYYVMPFVEGESLHDRLVRERQLPIEEALQIAREVADALAYAHSHDVVHRDIKPENILLSGGHAIVADFGIARAISAAGGDKVTETGLAIGTPAYMSPEQASGSGEVDRRSDIYSLGCVVYEMLAGMPPFTGPTAQAVMARHSLDSVPRLRIVRELVPDAVEDAILRALAKVPADRFATAYEFAQALTASSVVTPIARTASREVPGVAPRLRGARRAVWAALVVAVLGSGWAAWRLFGRSRAGAGADGLDPRRVAVLYFDDESHDSSLGHLADGLTEALINRLGEVRTLDVVSRNGVALYRGADLPRDSVARALKVGTLVQGSVEPVGQRFRVVVRLVDGTSGADIRRKTFELPSDQILGVRDSVAEEAALFLRERLGEEIRLRERLAETRSVAAWTLLQQAERSRKDGEAVVRTDPERARAAFERADTLLAQAEQADAQWVEPVLLRGKIAQRWARVVQARPSEADAAVARGLAHARRALERAPANPEVLELLGTLRYYRYVFRLVPREGADAELRAAQDDLQLAVQIRPLATAYATLSALNYQRRDMAAVVIAAQRAYEEDAYLEAADQVLWRLFLASYDGELHREASQACDEGARRFRADHRFVSCQLWLMTTEARSPDIEEGWRVNARADSLAPAAQRNFEHYRNLIFLGAAIGRAGLKDSARSVLLHSREGWNAEFGQEIVGMEAFARTQIGDYDEAIALLKRYIAGNPEHLFRTGGDLHWWWRPLKDHPDFRAISGQRP